VQAATAGWPLPFSKSHASITIAFEGRPVAKGDEPSEAIALAMPGYFETMRIPLLSGRTFNAQDGSKSAPVMIINQAFAKKYFPGESPIGKHIQSELGDGVIEHPMREIIGVVGDTKHRGLTADSEPVYYLPYSQALITNPYLIIRTNGNPMALAESLRTTIAQLDSKAPVYQVSTLENYRSKSVAQPRFQTLLLTCFAGIALLLSAVGLYGLLAYIVAQRSFEIGLRMALGAQRGNVVQLILNRGLTLAAIGVGLGMGVSVLLTRFLSSLLYGVKPHDPITFITVAAVLLAVSALASALPAARAASLDPMKTLRDQ
jgi:predicted permease